MKTRLLVGTRKGLFTLEKHASWQIVAHAFAGEPVTAVCRDANTGRLTCALNLGHYGVKLHSSNDGTQWREITTPSYPPEPENYSGTPWSLKQVLVLESAGTDRLWAGTLPGGLFRSIDGGHTWHLVESLWNRSERTKWMGGGYEVPGIHSICVDPQDHKTITVAVSCGGVWQTRDSGDSWQQCAHGMRAEFLPPEHGGDPERQDPHRMVQCAGEPKRFWVQHHNGIFRSDERGRNWQEITSATPSSFGFGVAVHPRDGDTAWFVPAVKDERRIPVDGALVVTRTRDGGRSFQELRAGLPQKHCYDLIYRHALDVDASGDQLAMGSTTGNLWCSADQGDYWQAVSQHLPPIHCLRFVEA